MLRKHFFMLLIATIIIGGFSCCKSTKTPMQCAQMTQKDSLLIQINNEYIPTSVVGDGAIIAKQESHKIAYQKNQDVKQRLEAIEGIKIQQVLHDGDSICDFIAEMGDILFEYDSFELTTEAIDIIDQLAKIINDMENTRIYIIGYTDSIGDETYNMKLSRLRALSVGNRLRENGITNITESGMGKSKPIASNSTAEGRKKNRRVEIKMFTEENQ